MRHRVKMPMKIVLPAFLFQPVLDEIRQDSAGEGVLAQCEFIPVDSQGRILGDPTGAEVVVLPWGLPTETVAALLDLPTLRWIHSVSAGVDHALRVVPDACQAVITNAAGLFDGPIAEMVMAYILAIAKRIPLFLQQQQRHQWHLLRLREVAGCTVGIIGLGRIGTEVARRCQGMGLRVIATRRHPDRGGDFADLVVGPDRLSEILSGADFVVITAPLTPETRGLLDRDALRQMRPDAWLINVARGAILDQEALIQALQEGWIGGAALDVFEEEPLPPDSPLWDLPNVIITPHNSWSTPHLKQREARLFVENLRRYLSGQPLLNVVDRSRGY